MLSTPATELAIATTLSHSPKTNQQYYRAMFMSRHKALELVSPVMKKILGTRAGGNGGNESASVVGSNHSTESAESYDVDSAVSDAVGTGHGRGALLT